MADVNIVIGAKDMASSVMRSVSAQTGVMANSVKAMSTSVVASTRAMSAGFMSLTASIAPLLAAMLSLQAAFAVFRFATDSVNAFIEAGSPAGERLQASLNLASMAITELMVSIGATLAPIIQESVRLIASLAFTFADVLVPAAGMVQVGMDSLRPVFDRVIKNTIGWITAIEVAVGNIGPLMNLASSLFMLGLTKIVEDVKYSFTVVLPSYIQWFGENAFNLLRDYFAAYTTILMNFAKNLGEFGAAVYTWIASGMQGGVDGLMTQLGESMYVSLLDGFEASTQALPEIAARQLTAYERDLAVQVGDIGGKLGNEFNKKFQDRLGSLSKKLTLPGTTPQAEENTKKLTSSLATVAESQASIAQQLTASESRLLTRGQSEGPIQTVANASQKTAVAAESTMKSSDRMVSLLEQFLAKPFVIAEAV